VNDAASKRPRIKPLGRGLGASSQRLIFPAVIQEPKILESEPFVLPKLVPGNVVEDTQKGRGPLK